MADEMEVFYQRFVEKQKQRDAAGAMLELDAALQLEPDNIDILFIRGCQHYLRREYAHAIVDLTRFIELGSDLDNLAEAHTKRAISYSYAGNSAALMEDLTWLIDHDFASANIYSWRGHEHFRAGNNQQSISDYTHALQLAPDTYNILIQRSHAYYQADQYENALQDLVRILDLGKSQHPGFLQVVFSWRGKNYYKLGRYEEALTDFHEMMRLQGKEPLETLADYAKTINGLD